MARKKILSKDPKYWRKRFLQLENASNAYGVEAFKKIEPAFESAQREIQREIESWFGRYARNNEITMKEARKQLSTRELKELRWDVNEYIKYGRENAINQQWVKELENASARFHISRLEALKIRTQQAAEVAFGNELDVIDDMARKVFTEDYYHSIFEVMKGFGIGWDIGQIDEKKLNTLITKPWAPDKKNFSDRIWQQRSLLINEVHQQLTRTCLLGKAPDQAIKAISKRFDVTKHQAGRLVMTEQAYFHSVAQKEAFEELDVEEYEIVATLDSHTSEICREMDGKHLPMSQYEAGVTAPPLHVWCRSVTVPWFEDDYGGERAARSEDGKTYYVPSDMTYKEWAKQYVNDANYGIYNYKISDKEQFDRYKAVLKEISPNNLKEFTNIKYNEPEKYSDLKRKYRLVNQYKVDSGEFSAQEILDLDLKVITDKRNNFPSDYKRSGNIAGAYLDFDDDKLFLAHSNINTTTDKGFKNYKGSMEIIPLQQDRHFNYIDVKKSNGETRGNTFYDTEAKLFEQFHIMSQTKEFKRITILSERGMCDSCKNVMEQFKKEHPNIEVRVISNKKVEGDVWGDRLLTEEQRKTRAEKRKKKKEGGSK